MRAATRPAGRGPGCGVAGRWLTVALTLLLAVGAAAGCTSGDAAPDPSGQVAVPFADCSGLSPQAGPASPSSTPRTGSSATDSDVVRLPDVSLPCFAGGAQVEVADLTGPAVINLWGSWCGPCREELPLMQELADATTGRLTVLGVDTRDDRDDGASFAAEHGVSMPTLFDPRTELLSALGKITLPVTVFVDPAGRQYVYNGKALDKPTLGGLVRTHTGVTVTG